MLGATGATVIGPSHKGNQEPNQDALFLRGSRGGWFLSVADGLGSRPLSHIGARLAVRIAHQILRDALFEKAPREAIQHFYQTWLSVLPNEDPRLMATTIVVASCRENGRCAIVQLGDGLALYRAGGAFGVITSERTGFSNETAALGITRSFSAWGFAEVQLSEPGDAVILMTDGVADDLVPERLEGFLKKLIRVAAARGRRRGKRWLEQQLECWPTAMHADDKTIGLIFRADR